MCRYIARIAATFYFHGALFPCPLFPATLDPLLVVVPYFVPVTVLLVLCLLMFLPSAVLMLLAGLLLSSSICSPVTSCAASPLLVMLFQEMT